MEKKLIDLRRQIFALLTNGIEASQKAKDNFLKIIAVLYGKESEDYCLFERLTTDKQKQNEMLRAEENHKHAANFKIFCHMVLEDYVEQLLLKTQSPEGESTTRAYHLYKYVSEVENVSQHKPGLFGFYMENFPELIHAEHHLRNDICKGKKLTAEETKMLLSVWLMYPQLIHNSEKIKEIIALFASQNMEF